MPAAATTGEMDFCSSKAAGYVCKCVWVCVSVYGCVCERERVGACVYVYEREPNYV